MALFTNEITETIVARLQAHEQTINAAVGHAGASPLRDDLALLIQIANGEFLRAHATPSLLQQAEAALQNLLALLFGNAMQSAYTIPDEFWRTQIGVLVTRVRWWISVDDLITISNAAALAFGENNQANRMRITRAIERGELNSIPDPSVANPQQNRRVLRSEVERLREQRQWPESMR